MFRWCFLSVSWYFLALFDIYEQKTGFLSREPDFQEFLKKPQNMFSWCFLSVSWYFLALFDIWAENRIFQPRIRFLKKFLKCLKACLVGIFWVFQSIFIIHLSGPRTGFLSREPDFQKILKKPQNMFSWWFLSVSMYFSTVRHLSREPDVWAENRIFKNFLKSLKHV